MVVYIFCRLSPQCCYCHWGVSLSLIIFCYNHLLTCSSTRSFFRGTYQVLLLPLALRLIYHIFKFLNLFPWNLQKHIPPKKMVLVCIFPLYFIKSTSLLGFFIGTIETCLACTDSSMARYHARVQWRGTLARPARYCTRACTAENWCPREHTLCFADRFITQLYHFYISIPVYSPSFPFTAPLT